jgi:lipoate-protein ligase A
MSDSNENWLLWEDIDRGAFMNMALDEALLLTCAKRGTVPLIRIYGWDSPAVSIGYVQDFLSAPQTGYTIVRRPTGGGVVYHDVDLTYTVVVPAGHFICGLDRIESYHVFHRAIQRVLEAFGLKSSLAESEMPAVDRKTMQCFTTPTRYDVLADGQKYAGAAQRRTREGILHQGSIKLEAANGERQALQQKLIWGVKEEFCIGFDTFSPDDELVSIADELAENKYSTPEWNRNKSKP